MRFPHLGSTDRQDRMVALAATLVMHAITVLGREVRFGVCFKAADSNAESGEF